jgi:hypothetical protein
LKRHKIISNRILFKEITFFQSKSPALTNHDSSVKLHLQLCLGLSWAGGTLLTGLLFTKQSRDFQLAKVYLWQNVLLFGAIVTLCGQVGEAASSGPHFFQAWLYGAFLGAYGFTLKSYLFERVRSKDFSQALSLLYACQALPAGLSIPLLSQAELWIHPGFGKFVSGFCMLASAIIVYISANCGKGKLERARFKTRKTQTSTADLEALCTCQNDEQMTLPKPNGFVLGDELNNINEALMRRLLWREQELGDYDDFYDNDFDYDYYDEGNVMILADENYEEYLLGDNITSCNKVEHDLMISEFEQNLSKESEKLKPGKSSGGTAGGQQNSNRQSAPSAMASSRLGRLWTLRRQSTEDLSLSDRSVSSANNGDHGKTKDTSLSKMKPTDSGAASLPKFRNPNLASRLQKERSITVIEEVSST